MINEELAIPKVESFSSCWRPWTPWAERASSDAAGGFEQIRKEVDGSLPLIKQIANDCDPELAERIDCGLNAGWGIQVTKSATAELLGYLKKDAEARKEIFTPTGPKLAMSNMHPWVQGDGGAALGGRTP